MEVMHRSNGVPEHHGQSPPTASHALAEESAALQLNWKTDRDTATADDWTEVGDIAWEDSHVEFQTQFMEMPHEDFWILTRRFNYLVFRVMAVKDRPLSNLDMGTSEHEKTSPKQIQAQLARLYIEPRRTLAFLSVYVVAWFADILVPTFFISLAALVFFPPLRPILFPPAPPSIIDARTGGLKMPPAGVMASETSVTGAPENHKGEAVELEAHSFLSSFAELITSITSSGADDQNAPEDDPAPRLANLAGKFTDAKSKTDHEGQDPGQEDQTRQPMKHAIEDVKIQPILDALVDFIDTWERFANVLNPTPLFGARDARLLLSACFLLPAIATLCLSRDVIMRGCQLCPGFVFFGRPLILQVYKFLDSRYPDWRIRYQLRHTILRGVPTNAQLTITMLRLGERNKSPLLPSPASRGAPIAKAAATSESLHQLGMNTYSIFMSYVGYSVPQVFIYRDWRDAEETNENFTPRQDMLRHLNFLAYLDPSGLIILLIFEISVVVKLERVV
ncbi:hypothetical protein HJFPF1_10717 [Paramyrothecium foliicola]|nr:hypothetical protein HJFPF1_10717 [Paramyrothecium foliicola]